MSQQALTRQEIVALYKRAKKKNKILLLKVQYR
jgi:hypothetical protein